MIKSIRLLKALARGNDVVQKRIYDRMDTLLKVRVVESEESLWLLRRYVITLSRDNEEKYVPATMLIQQRRNIKQFKIQKIHVRSGFTYHNFWNKCN